MCKRDPAKLKAAIAKAVGAPAIVTPYEVSGDRDSGASKQLDATPAAAAVAGAASDNVAGGAAAVGSFARTSNSSDAAGSVRRTSAGAASDASSALPSSHSDGSGATRWVMSCSVAAPPDILPDRAQKGCMLQARSKVCLDVSSCYQTQL